MGGQGGVHLGGSLGGIGLQVAGWGPWWMGGWIAGNRWYAGELVGW